MTKQYRVATPVELPNSDKTIWVTLGRAFEGEGTKYALKVSMSALPLSAFKGDPLELFLFEDQEMQREPRARRSTKSYKPSSNNDGPSYPDDVPF